MEQHFAASIMKHLPCKMANSLLRSSRLHPVITCVHPKVVGLLIAVCVFPGARGTLLQVKHPLFLGTWCYLTPNWNLMKNAHPLLYLQFIPLNSSWNYKIIPHCVCMYWCSTWSPFLAMKTVWLMSCQSHKPSVSVLFIHLLKRKAKGWIMALETQLEKKKCETVKCIPT